MKQVDEVLAGNRRLLARTISEVENGGPEAQELLGALYPHTGRAHIVGITGAPGTGKSTLVNALARGYRVAGQTVGIIAVDPTSPFTGGALLGDRVRMRDLAGDAGIFIRSMATRGNLGGLARATADVALILDAAGFERILIETVGVGQAEVEIASAAHTTVVVAAPDMGDVQAIKAGILEIADLFAVNKADREGADRTVMALVAMQQLERTFKRCNVPTFADPEKLGAQPNGSWLAPIVRTVATCGEGVAELHEWVERHAAYLQNTGQRTQREIARATAAVTHILRERLLADLLARIPGGANQLAALMGAVARRELDPYTAAGRLIAQ